MMNKISDKVKATLPCGKIVTERRDYIENEDMCADTCEKWPDCPQYIENLDQIQKIEEINNERKEG